MNPAMMKRAGLLIGVLVCGVLAFELTMTFLRQRTVSITIRTTGSAVTVPTPFPLTGDATPTPIPEDARQIGESNVGSTIFIARDGVVLLDVTWDYRIGPRFPPTLIRADVTDGQGGIVAAHSHTITCDQVNALACSGVATISLTFNEQDGVGEGGLWQTGRYMLNITRAYAGLRPEIILRREVTVNNE